jgi:hypothetical protein
MGTLKFHFSRSRTRIYNNQFASPNAKLDRNRIGARNRNSLKTDTIISTDQKLATNQYHSLNS